MMISVSLSAQEVTDFVNIDSHSEMAVLKKHPINVSCSLCGRSLYIHYKICIWFCRFSDTCIYNIMLLDLDVTIWSIFEHVFMLLCLRRLISRRKERESFWENKTEIMIPAFGWETPVSQVLFNDTHTRPCAFWRQVLLCLDMIFRHQAVEVTRWIYEVILHIIIYPDIISVLLSRLLPGMIIYHFVFCVPEGGSWVSSLGRTQVLRLQNVTSEHCGYELHIVCRVQQCE